MAALDAQRASYAYEVTASADAMLRRLADEIRAACERVADLERRRVAIEAQLAQPWDQVARCRRTIEDLNRVNAEMVKDGTITAEEAAPVELVEEEAEAAASADDDPPIALPTQA